MKNILYLHGLGATPLSFAFLSHLLPSHNRLSIQMQPNELVKDSAEHAEKLLNESTAEDVTIVAHSLGGVVGVNLLKLPSVTGMVSLSSPFGGHAAAILLWQNRAMFKNLAPFGSTIRSLQQKWSDANKPHLAIVTSRGLPVINEANDSVVTVSSQMALVGPEYVQNDNLNHFEVLLSPDVAKQIENFVWR